MNDAPEIRRVLQVHTRYRQAGGEDQVVEAERGLLASAGIDVHQVVFDNADLRESRSLAGDVSLAVSAAWNRDAARRVAEAVASLRPDAVHVHNTFAAASPAVYRAAGRAVVQTLHNYRFVCPAATAFRDGRPCTDCVGRAVPWPAILHGCVRGSRPESAAATATLALHRALGTFDRIGAWIALTEFQRSLLAEGGVPADRIRVIPNFREPDPGAGTGERDGVLYLGRLAEEKGIATLLDAARAAPGVVRIAGSGPLDPQVEASAAAGHVIRLGRLDAPAALEAVRGAVALVLPSIWFEGFPLVLLEAYASATPVIATRLGSLAEIVEDGVTGLLVRPADPDDLRARIRWAVGHPDEMARMGAAARQRYESRYRGPAHLEALLAAYRELAARAPGPAAQARGVA